MNTLTPRTDQEIQRCTMVHFITESNDDGYGVKANFTRQLERELASVTEQRDKLIKAIEPLEYWRDISECDCSCPLPQGGCLRCDLNRILKLTKPNS
jgi:hypothetical protein